MSSNHGWSRLTRESLRVTALGTQLRSSQLGDLGRSECNLRRLRFQWLDARVKNLDVQHALQVGRVSAPWFGP